jgi:hypothetical protein
MINIPALPTYIGLSDEAAPEKVGVWVEGDGEGEGDEPLPLPMVTGLGVVMAPDPVPVPRMAVGPALAVVLLPLYAW